MNRSYFDYNATTPVSSEVLEVLIPAMTYVYGNASSIHQDGQAAKQKLEAARRQMGALLRCGWKDIVFTSGGTEANNIAVLGAVRAHPARQKHVVTTAIEHHAVLKTCERLEREGVAVTYVPFRSPERLAEEIQRALRPTTVLVSVMHANNETGAILPLQEIAAVAREAGVLFHSDGVQAVGKIPVDVEALGVDLYSISGHKIYAPKGIGALYVRKGVNLDPLMHGGRHERGLRPGTENVPAAMALGRAAAWLSASGAEEAARLAELRDRLETKILAAVPQTTVTAADSPRVPNTTNIRFDGIEGEALLIALDLRGFAVSSGAACSSGAVEPSHVLTAMGMSKGEARSCLRFSLGRANTIEQVDALVEAVAQSVAQLRRVSTWEPAHA